MFRGVCFCGRAAGEFCDESRVRVGRGVVNLTSTDLELVNDGAAGNQTVGLRFSGLAIPPCILAARHRGKRVRPKMRGGFTRMRDPAIRGA